MPDAAPLTTAHAMGGDAREARRVAPLCDRTMSDLTLRTLADDPALGLRLLAGAAAEDRTVQGGHTTDLDRPGRYLLPGELVLTNGLWTAHVDGATWARDVATAGAAAIGFGLSELHPSVPEDLRAACEALGLPLLEVPEELSFSMIAGVVDGGRDPSGLRLQLSRTRRLLQRLGGGGGHAALLDFLRHETRLPVWLVGPGGRPLVDGDATDPDPDLARAAARAARRGELPAAVSEGACAFGAAPVAAARSALLVGVPLAEIGDDARLVIEQVAAYVVLEDARARAREEGRTALAAELVELAWSGDLSAAAMAARLRALGFAPERPIAVVASANDGRDTAYAAAGCDEPCVTARHRDATLFLVETDAEDVTDRLAGLVADGGSDPVLGAGRPVTAPADPAGLRQSVAEAITALGLAGTRPAGQRVVRHLDIGAHALLLDFVDRQVLLAFREAVLGPLERWDRGHGAELVHTLRTFLQHDGHWRATAAQLHIHHNTLRYRIDRVGALTGRAADSTAGRVDFALALAIAT
jgi:Fe2+ transport system protein FeoA